MEVNTFIQSLKEAHPPTDVSQYLKAMWYVKKGNWNRAHEIVQDLPDKTAAWIHAYLHRIEGDLWNADYWYRRANRERPGSTLDEEWDHITTALVENIL